MSKVYLLQMKMNDRASRRLSKVQPTVTSANTQSTAQPKYAYLEYEDSAIISVSRRLKGNIHSYNLQQYVRSNTTLEVNLMDKPYFVLRYAIIRDVTIPDILEEFNEG